MPVRSATFCAGTLVAAMVAAPVSTAHALTMKECSAKYKAAQEAGTLDGMKWNDFRKSECGADASTAPQTRRLLVPRPRGWAVHTHPAHHDLTTSMSIFQCLRTLVADPNRLGNRLYLADVTIQRGHEGLTLKLGLGGARGISFRSMAVARDGRQSSA